MAMTRRGLLRGTVKATVVAAQASLSLGAAAVIDHKMARCKPRIKGKLLVDLHAHAPSNCGYESRKKLKDAILRVGAVGIAQTESMHTLTYKDAVTFTGASEIEAGRLAVIEEGNLKAFIINSQEIKPKFPLMPEKAAYKGIFEYPIYPRMHILAVGCQKLLTHAWRYFAQDAIKLIHDNGGIAILAHPYVIGESTRNPPSGLRQRLTRIIGHREITAEEELAISELMLPPTKMLPSFANLESSEEPISLPDYPPFWAIEETMPAKERPDEIEVFNAQNILMFGDANEKALRLALANGYNGIAVSDSHAFTSEFGVAGILVDENVLSCGGLNGLFSCIRKGQFSRVEGYQSYLGMAAGHSTVLDGLLRPTGIF